MKCTISRKHSLKSFVALVVFSFSLVVACISPVWAVSTSGDPDSFAVYVGYPGQDPPYNDYGFVVPFSGDSVFSSLSPDSTLSNVFFYRYVFMFKVHSSQF